MSFKERILWTIIVVISAAILFAICLILGNELFCNMITIVSFCSLPFTIIAFIWTFQKIKDHIDLIKKHMHSYETKQDLWISGNLIPILEDLIKLIGAKKFKVANDQFSIIRRFLVYTLSAELQEDLKLEKIEKDIRAYAQSTATSPVKPRQIKNLEEDIRNIRNSLEKFYTDTKAETSHVQ